MSKLRDTDNSFSKLMEIASAKPGGEYSVDEIRAAQALAHAMGLENAP